MGLNIKNPRTHALVRQLAELTGQTQTGAVEDAVRRRLDDLTRSSGAQSLTREQTARRERIQTLIQEFNADLDDSTKDRIRHADGWLYDELGLPR